MKDTKRKILSAALSCFIDKSVEETSIADIRKESGISVGSIYHHFANKDAIVVNLFMTGMQDHAQLQKTSLEQLEGAEAGVKAVVSCYIDWIVTNPDWARFIFRYRGLVDHVDQSELNRERKREHYAYLRDWFTPHIDAGQLKALPFEVYHSLIIGPAQDYALRWLRGDARQSLAELRELYAEAAWQSVRGRQ